MENSFYNNFLIYNIPRLLTQIDRDLDSNTYGSCDRNYWHLKIRDFSSAILQQTALTLAIVYITDFPGNIYFNKKNILSWAKAVIRFWAGIQLGDGSFNEYYPGEHSIPATAFSLFAVSETCKRLNIDDTEINLAMKKAYIFLSKNPEKEAINQEIASITGLYSYYSICGNNRVLESIDRKIKRILIIQSNDGWFPEYGGADLGYLSVSLDFLAEYYNLSNDKKVQKSLESIIRFISYFCHPDNSFGGEYGSRNTIYLLPNGIETMIKFGNKAASEIKRHIFHNNFWHNFHNAIDDRYFSHYILHSYARSIEKEIKNRKLIIPENSDILPCNKNHYKYFEDSGLLTFREEDIYGIFSLKKGGIIKIFKKDKEIFSENGYRCFINNSIATSNWLDSSYEIKVSGLDNITVEGCFNIVKRNYPSPLKHIILRLSAIFLGKRIVSILKNNLIFNNRQTKTRFIRNIKLNGNRIYIEDRIFPHTKVRDFHKSPVYSLRHVASGNFYHSSELLEYPILQIEELKNPIVIKQEIDLLSGRIQLHHEKLQKSYQ